MKVDRLISIIMILLEKKRVKAQKLADTFEVSLRTIYRDIEAIDLAGIPITSTSGVRGGFEIMGNYKIDKNVFSTTELCTLLTGLSCLSNIEKGQDLTHALTKVKNLIPPDKTQQINLKTNQLYIDLSQWAGNKNIKPYIETIKEALEENKVLKFEYIAHHGKKSLRTVNPYQIVLKNSHWYLYGYCHKRKDNRLFRISRILKMQLQKETFLTIDYEKPQLEFEHILETITTKIQIRIHKSIIDRVVEYCHYEDLTPQGKNHYIALLPFVENEYHYDLIMGFGDKCQCIGPPHVRQKIKEKIQKMAAIYA